MITAIKWNDLDFKPLEKHPLLLAYISAVNGSKYVAEGFFFQEKYYLKANHGQVDVYAWAWFPLEPVSDSKYGNAWGFDLDEILPMFPDNHPFKQWCRNNKLV